MKFDELLALNAKVTETVSKRDELEKQVKAIINERNTLINELAREMECKEDESYFVQIRGDLYRMSRPFREWTLTPIKPIEVS